MKSFALSSITKNALPFDAVHACCGHGFVCSSEGVEKLQAETIGLECWSLREGTTGSKTAGAAGELNCRCLHGACRIDTDCNILAACQKSIPERVRD